MQDAAELKSARKRWQKACGNAEKLYAVREYVNTRYKISCRIGDTPTSASWQRMLHKLEDILSTTRDAAAHFAWAQSFEYVPSGKTKKEGMLKTRSFMGENKYRYVEHPHGLHEIASETAFSQEFTYSDDFMLVRREPDMSEHEEDEDSNLEEAQSPAAPQEQVEDDTDEPDADEPEVQSIERKIWVVESEGEYTVFSARAEALEAAKAFVTSGVEEALVFTAIATELVTAVVRRTAVVSGINKNAP